MDPSNFCVHSTFDGYLAHVNFSSCTECFQQTSELFLLPMSDLVSFSALNQLLLSQVNNTVPTFFNVLTNSAV